jgi:hypothetical protein
MKEPTNHTQPPPDHEGAAFISLEQDLANEFAKALREEQMDSYMAQINQSVKTLKTAVETPEDRGIRLCSELIGVCRSQPS